MLRYYIIKLCVLLLGTMSYRCTVDNESLLSAKEWSIPKPSPVPEEFVDLALTVIKEDGINTPASVDDAVILYKHLKCILNC